MKTYEKPILNEERVEIEDVIAQSITAYGDRQIGDKRVKWPFEIRTK